MYTVRPVKKGTEVSQFFTTNSDGFIIVVSTPKSNNFRLALPEVFDTLTLAKHAIHHLNGGNLNIPRTPATPL